MKGTSSPVFQHHQDAYRGREHWKTIPAFS